MSGLGQLPMALDARRTAPAASLLKPRDYQEEALRRVFGAEAKGVARQMLVLPTGSGKTVIFCHLIDRWDGPAVVIVHRDELVAQTRAKVRTIAPRLTVGVVKAEQDETLADVVIASAQTIAHERRLNRLVAATRDQRLLVISDEAHHDVAPTRRRALAALTPSLLVGVTATPMRGDGIGLGGIYEQITYSVNLLDLMRTGVLAPLTGLRIDAAADLDAVHTLAGEFNEGELDAAVNTPARNRLIVESYQKHAANRTRTVAFCVSVQHAMDLAAEFLAAGISAATITGATPPEERRRLLDAFRAGTLPVLINCMVLTEGYDEPGIDCILMARPTKSQALYIQMAGRGARTSPETAKADCLVIDVVDVTSRHKLITLPTLAGADGEPDNSSGGDPRENGEQVSLLEYADGKRTLKEAAAVAVNLYNSSDFFWQEVAGVRMARIGFNVYAVMEHDTAGYRPLLMQAEGGLFFLSPLVREPLEELGYAMAIAEAAAAPFIGDAGAYVSKSRQADWKTGKNKPTQAQLDTLRRYDGRDFDPKRYPTKAAASAEIARRTFEWQYKEARKRYGYQS